MIEMLLACLLLVGVALIVALFFLARQIRRLTPCVADSALRTRELMTSTECLCGNVDKLRQQIGHGHAA